MSRIKGGRKNGDRASDRCGDSGICSAPGRLARRIKDFEAMSGGRGAKNTYSAEAFHKPGSNKK